MGRTTEEPIPVNDHYISTLRTSLSEAVTGEGNQSAIGERAGVTQGTISRILNGQENRLTYTTLAKLARVLMKPPPVVAVRDADHERWCRLGAVLAERDPETFTKRLRDVERDANDLGVPQVSAKQVDDLKSVIARPLPTRRRGVDREG